MINRRLKSILYLFLFPLTGIQTIEAQNLEKATFMVGVHTANNFTQNGYVQVREDGFAGNELAFGKNALNMELCMNLGAALELTFKNRHSLLFEAERYFFSNNSNITSEVWYNGAHLNGSEGLRINSSSLYHGKLSYLIPFFSNSKYEYKVEFGLIYDGLIFYVEGEVLADTYRYEQLEKFIRQSLPYPFIGAHFSAAVANRSAIEFQVNGTYIPWFKSTFNEGGQMSLQYSTFNLSSGYFFTPGKFSYGASLFYNSLAIHQESIEDSNDFELRTPGIRFDVKMKLD